MVALIGDNSATNHAFVDLTKTPFIGCASHRMNLGVVDILEHHKRKIDQVRSIMKKLRSPIASAKLKKFTHLKAVLSNDTRWSFVSTMLKHYGQLKKHLDEIDIADIKPLLLNTTDDNAIEALSARLDDLNTVSKSLQQDTCNLAEVWLII